MVFEHNFKDFPELTNKQLGEIGFTSPHVQITEDFTATVIKVTDGDTIRLRTDFRDFDFPLRLLNIDAPELNEGGEEAAEFLRGQIEGEEVNVKINIQNRVGKFGRLLGEVVSSGINVGESLVRLGYAVPFGKKNEGQAPDINKMFRENQWFK